MGERDLTEVASTGVDLISTVNLPYQPPASAKRELEKKYREGRANGGAHTWIFSGLSTACQEDLCFSVLNMANRVATVWIELFFEDRERNLRFIKAEVWIFPNFFRKTLYFSQKCDKMSSVQKRRKNYV